MSELSRISASSSMLKFATSRVCHLPEAAACNDVKCKVVGAVDVWKAYVVSSVEGADKKTDDGSSCADMLATSSAMLELHAL